MTIDLSNAHPFYAIAKNDGTLLMSEWCPVLFGSKAEAEADAGSYGFPGDRVVRVFVVVEDD